MSTAITAATLAESVIANQSWWGGTLNPPGDRRVLGQLIAAAIERGNGGAPSQDTAELTRLRAENESLRKELETLREGAKAGGGAFRKTKA